jgi:hypothetical protein
VRSSKSNGSTTKNRPYTTNVKKSPEIIHYKRLNKEPMSADNHTGAQSLKEAAEDECGVADGEVLPPVFTTAGVEAAPVAALVVADIDDDNAATDPV